MSEDSGTSAGGDSISTDAPGGGGGDTDQSLTGSAGPPPHPLQRDIELVFKPHPELEGKDDTGAQTRYIKTTANASGESNRLTVVIVLLKG